MDKIRVLLLLGLLITFAANLSSAEHIHLRFSFKTNSMGDGDLNTWVQSVGSRWRDWQQQNGGQLEGQFAPVDYGSNLEVELRIPLFAGLALNIGGSRLSSSADGQINYNNDAEDEHETENLSNSVKATALKFGFSYSYPLPFFPRVSVIAGGGRHIMFIQYESEDNYDYHRSLTGDPPQTFHNWYQKQNTYNSEALGYHASLGAEFELIEYIAVFLEAEKTWSKADGFKGRHSYIGDFGFGEIREGGKATLYFYESSKTGLGRYYPVLTGHKKRPDEFYIQNVRQGELNFDNFSFKIGITFKF
jgi:hypothetical protein